MRHSGALPKRGESYPLRLFMVEDLEVAAIVTGSRLRTRSDGSQAQKAWDLTLVVDRSDSPLLLRAESGGGTITPLAESRSADEPEAHGYTDTPGPEVLDAGEAVPHDQVKTFAESREAAQRFASEKVDVLARRRARSMANRVHDALMQARARGIDPEIEDLEAWLADRAQALRKAA